MSFLSSAPNMIARRHPRHFPLINSALSDVNLSVTRPPPCHGGGGGGGGGVVVRWVAS